VVGTNTYTGGTGTPSTSVTNLVVGANYQNSAPLSCADGDIAECALWDAALTAAEIDSLFKLVPVTQVRPGNLVSYSPILGKNDPEIDVVGGYALTAAHPRIIYPHRRPMYMAPAAAAGGVYPIFAIKPMWV
jgi:hypothetical protein